jgi:hypothetical protein
MSLLFDTLAYTKGAEAVGIVREHAEYQAQQINKILDNNVATKSDLSLLEKYIDSKFIIIGERFNLIEEKMKSLENRMIIKLGSLMVIGLSILGFILKH